MMETVSYIESFSEPGRVEAWCEFRYSRRSLRSCVPEGVWQQIQVGDDGFPTLTGTGIGHMALYIVTGGITRALRLRPFTGGGFLSCNKRLF